MEAQENSVTRSRLCGSENGTDILGWRFTHQNRFPFKSSLETVRSLLVKQKNQPALGYVAVRCFQTIPMEAKAPYEKYQRKSGNCTSQASFRRKNQNRDTRHAERSGEQGRAQQ